MAAKKKEVAKDMDSYIQAFPEATQEALTQMRNTIKKASPTSTETINYGIPTFRLNGNLVHFAGYQKHVGFYVGGTALSEFGEDLSGFKTGRGTIQFPLNKPMPLALVTRIVKYQTKQALAKTKTSSKPASKKAKIQSE